MNAISYYEDLIRYLNQLLQNLSNVTMTKEEEASLSSSIQGIINLSYQQMMEIKKDEG